MVVQDLDRLTRDGGQQVEVFVGGEDGEAGLFGRAGD